MEQSLSIPDLLNELKRRWLLVLAIIVAVSAIAVAVAYFLPPVYRSGAKILVESQQIPGELATSTVTGDSRESLQKIEQRLLISSTLREIVDKHSLFADRADLTVSDKVGRLLKAIKIESIIVEDAFRRKKVSAFEISATSNNAITASRIANELVTRILELNIATRNKQAAETHNFFKQRVQKLGADILAIENQITEFKNANDLALPDSLEFRRTEVSRLQERMFEWESQRLELEEELRLLRQALESGQVASLVTDQPLTPQEIALQRLQDLLTQRRGVLSETHPEIRALKSQIKSMENSMSVSVVRTDASVQGGVTEGRETARRAELARQVELIEKQIAVTQQQMEASEARIGQLQASIEQTPQVEMSLNALNRTHHELQTQYDTAVERQAEAATGEQLEVNRQGERFEVIEPAVVPERPVSPNRKLIAAAGFVGSVGMGFGVVFLLFLLNKSVRSVADMERKLEYRPFATVPYILTGSEIRRKKWTRRIIFLLFFFLVPAALYVVDQQVMPLTTIVEKVVNKMGLYGILQAIETRLGT